MAESTEPLKKTRSTKSKRLWAAGWSTGGGARCSPAASRESTRRAHYRRCVDVSHMGDHGARTQAVAVAWTCNDVAVLVDGRAPPASPERRVVDDILIYTAERFLRRVNASNSTGLRLVAGRARMDVEVLNRSAITHAGRVGSERGARVAGYTSVLLRTSSTNIRPRTGRRGHRHAPAILARTVSRSTQSRSTRRASCKAGDAGVKPAASARATRCA
jgi:hypothetical protein